MIFQRLLLSSHRFGRKTILSLPSNTVVSSILTTRSYCMEKCWEEKSYDEDITSLIGNREMVGFGMNGNPFYYDCSHFPFPAIRYKELTPETMALREKERGDWRLLSIEDKKELYRTSYCQTFSEFKYTHSTWMAIVGWTLMFASLGIWAYMFFSYFVDNPRPKTFRAAYKQAALKRMLDLHVNPITGISSKFDYVKKEWKSRGILFGPPPNPYADEQQKKEEEEEPAKEE